MAETYGFEDEIGYYYQNSESFYPDQDIIWDRHLITPKEIQKAEQVWHRDIFPNIEETYNFLFALTQDKNIQQDISVQTDSQSYAIQWEPKLAEDIQYDHYIKALDTLKDKGVAVENYVISPQDFEEFIDYVSNYSMQINLTIPKDENLINDFRLMVKPKNTHKDAYKDNQEGPLSYPNPTLFVQMDDIHYNKEIHLNRPQDGELLDLSSQAAPDLEDTQGLARFKEQASAFYNEHKEAPDQVSIADFEKAFDITIPESGFESNYNSNNGLYVISSGDEFDYQLQFENDQANQPYQHYQNLFDAVSKKPELMKEPEKLLETYPVPEEAPVKFLSPEEHGKGYFIEDSLNNLLISINKNNKMKIFIMTDPQTDLNQLTYENYEEKKQTLKHIDQWIEDIGPFNGITHSYLDDSNIIYIWQNAPYSAGNQLKVFADYDGNVVDSYYMVKTEQ